MTPTTFAAAAKAPMHPALRWSPLFSEDRAQHRRTEDGGTGCGLAGPLTLAEADAERCTRGCWK